MSSQLERCEHILYFTGSMTSKALLILLVTEKQPLTKVLFLASKNEMRITYENVAWAQKFCKTHDIEFEIITRKKLLASIRDIKFHQYIYVSIRLDEAYRIRKETRPMVTKIYPLVDRGIKIKQCLEIIKRFENT